MWGAYLLRHAETLVLILFSTVVQQHGHFRVEQHGGLARQRLTKLQVGGILVFVGVIHPCCSTMCGVCGCVGEM